MLAAKIDKLSILGIRSFSASTCEVIEFLTPLTLIVGFNGSGKTTIIECLKFATTGTLPDGAKTGEPWIHDPKLCGEREVLGQVRLSFHNGVGERHILTRNMSLTVNRSSRSFKTLETTLVKKKRNGERESVSTRHANINELMPDLLGVSRAVLENVIFCHQENSLWPMQAPADLKKKFDDIFEAVKYTQAVDNIKKLRKEYSDSLKTLKVIEENAKVDKDRGVKLEKETQDLTDELEAMRDDHKKLEEAKDRIQSELDECQADISRLSTLEGELTGKRIQMQTKQESISKLERNIKVMSESDEDLQKMLDDFEERVEALTNQVASQKRELAEHQSSINKTRIKLSAKEQELGRLVAQKDNHDRQVESRKRLVREIARTHNIRAFDRDLEDDEIDAFRTQMASTRKTQSQAQEKAREKTREELQKAQMTLSSINERKSGYLQSRELARNSIAANEKRIHSLQAEFDRIEVDEGARALLESSISDAEARLRKHKDAFDSAGWDRSIENVTSQVNTLEEEKDKLDAELAEGAKRAGEVARLEYFHKEVKTCERGLQSMMQTYGDRITELVKTGWTVAGLENDYNKILRSKSAQIADAERQRDGLSNELAKVNYRLSDCRKEMKAKNGQVQMLTKSFHDEVKDRELHELPEYLAGLEMENENESGREHTADVMADYFKVSLENAKQHAVCRLCSRGFDPKSKAMDIFLAKLDKNIQNCHRDKDPEAMQQLQEELSVARSFKPSYDTWKRLTEDEIPALQEREKRLSADSDKLNDQLQAADQVVMDRQGEHSEVESLSTTVKSMVKYHTDVTAHRRQISDLETKQSHAGKFRPLDDIKESIRTMGEQIRALRSQATKLSSDRDRARNSINANELELRDLAAKLESANYKLKERSALQEQIGELRKANIGHREALSAADENIQAISPELGQAQSAYDEIGRLGSEKDDKFREKLATLDSSLSRLQMADNEIRAYTERDGPTQLYRCESTVESIRNQIVETEQKASQIDRDSKMIENQLRNNEDTKRCISDNLDYRQDQRDIENVRKDIAELESHQVEEEISQRRRQAKQLENEKLINRAAESRLVGQMSEKDVRLGKNYADWETDYKDAAYKYKEAHVRVATTKAAVEDLGRYGGALENAVMKYHSLKMDEVNRIIAELWNRTYQGTDIDTIVIKSENETLKGGKSYKYRVCMVKQEAEMEMRGRCSAGQKVLASIIIRLALAECFGVNCGLIALDEPTTNLDRDNIQALAKALSEIIRVRRKQSNFQLIVITHDEEFLKYMHCSDYADEYYRVSRDANQDTEIVKQSIGHVMN